MNAKKLVLTALCILLAVAAAGQKRRRATTPKEPAVPYIEQARQALKAYRFDDARQAAEKEIEALGKKKQRSEEAERIARQAEKGLLALHATERIVIIDSLVCPKEQALAAIKLSSESGRIDTYASTYHTADANGATIYENDFANKRFFPVADSTGAGDMKLAVSHKIGEQWSAPAMLKGLNNQDVRQNYPFMLSDGVTLYYAADGPEGMGGYDIFVTRADGEDGSFLTPENLGFPYNSPANDYLLIIDELAQIGWFISDRNQPEGKVCVYTFIPNSTRQTYQELSDEALRERARIVSISNTWSGAEQARIEEARQRVERLRDGKNTQQAKTDFRFVIDDSRTYTTISDFKSARARQLMQQWLQLNKNTQTDAILLERMRDNYISATSAQRPQLRQSILQMEGSLYQRQREQEQLAKEIRNAEIARQ